MATLTDVVGAVEARGGRLQRGTDGQFHISCPLHEDKTPSLHVGEKNGELVLHCFGCDGTFVELLDALELREVGSPPPSAKHREQKRKRTAMPAHGSRWKTISTYDYVDEHGELQYQIKRQELKNANGQSVRREDGKPEKRFDSTGVTKERRIPYRLDQLQAAKVSGARVFFVEGEKCADFVVEKLGAFATTLGSVTAFDAERHAHYFEGVAELVVIPDESDEAKKAFVQAANRLADGGSTCRYVELPGREKGQDIVDWFAGHNVETRRRELAELVERAAPVRPRFELVSTLLVEPDEEPSWLIRDLVPANEETVCIYARERTGKSLMAHELCFALATGTNAFGMERFTVPEPVSVLYVAEEDPRVSTRRRLRWFAKAREIPFEEMPPTFRISIKKGWHFDRSEDQERLVELALRYEARFIVLDPIIRLTHLVGGTGKDFAPFADFLMRLTRQTEATVACVHHDVKGFGEERSHRDAISGGGVLAAMTAPMHLVKVKDDERQVVPNGYKFFEAPAAFAFRIVTPEGLPFFDPNFWMRLEGETKSEAKAKHEALEDGIRVYLEENPCTISRELRNALGDHRASDVDLAVKNMVKRGKVLVHPGRRNAKHHRLAKSDCGCPKTEPAAQVLPGVRG